MAGKSLMEDIEGAERFLRALVVTVMARGGPPLDLVRFSAHPKAMEKIADLMWALQEQVLLEQQEGEVRFGPRFVHVEQGVVRGPEGVQRLPPMERQLLMYLLQSQECPLDIRELMTKAWPGKVSRASIQMTVQRLRARLADSSKQWIVNIHGQGYVARPEI